VIDVRVFDDLSDDQWLEWQAIALIDGWHNGWLHAAQVMAHMTNQTNRIVLSQMEKPAQAAKQMKWVSGYEVAEQLQSFGQKKKKEGMTPKQAEAILRAQSR